MATSSTYADQETHNDYLTNSYHEDQEEDDDDHEDEALSLCDLPVNLSNEDQNNLQTSSSNRTQLLLDHHRHDEFDFGSSVGSLTQPLMCAADELFFQGQILPIVRTFSVGSEHSLSSTSGINPDTLRHNLRCINSSESMVDHRTRSNSSRSDSSSKNSSIRPKIPNYLFHSHPSPKPHIRVSKPDHHQENTIKTTNQKSSSSSAWEIFRLGFVRTPGSMEKDLKNRNSKENSLSRNSSNNNTTTKVFLNNKKNSTVRPRVAMDQIKRTTNGIFGGVSCKFSVDTVPNNNIHHKIVMKSNSTTRRSIDERERKAHAIREKVLLELKMKKQKQKQIMQKQKQEQGKMALSRYRTLEWLKQLSHESFNVPDGA